jgi:hypothetical protein
MPPRSSKPSSGGVPPSPAQHVRVALGQPAQPARPGAGPKAPGVRQPVALHVQAAVGTVQRKQLGPVSGNRQVAAHVQASFAAVQAKLVVGVAQCAKTKLYHATTADNAKSIMKQGLLVKEGGKGKGLSTSLGTKEDSENRIFFLETLQNAKSLGKFGTVEVVIEAELDDEDYTIHSTGSMGGSYVTKDVPIKLLTIVWTKNIVLETKNEKVSGGGCVIL